MNKLTAKLTHYRSFAMLDNPVALPYFPNETDRSSPTNPDARINFHSKGGRLQYLKVRFPTRRKVKVDDEFNGYTNKLIEIRGGPHKISMGNPKNFKPKERKVTLRSTSPLRPKIVRFEKIDVSSS